MCLIFQLEVLIELTQVIVLHFDVLCHQIALFDLFLHGIRADNSLMVDLKLESLDRAVSDHHLILQVFYPVLLQVARKLKVVILLLEALVLENSHAQLLLQLPVLLPQFEGLLQSQRLLP